MTTFTVTTAADVVANDGELSLREAVANANATAAPDTINFDAVLEGTTLLLTGGELTLSRDVTIDGDANNDGSEVTLSAGNASRLLNIAGTDTDVSLRDLALTEGRGPVYFSEGGGAILLGGGSLAMTGCTISDSFSFYAAGGGIFAADNSRLTITDSSIVGNHASGDVGGGIGTGSNVALTVRNSLFSDNTGDYGGGAIRLNGSLSMEDSTVSNNGWSGFGGGGGGGLRLYGTATIARSTISGNDAYHFGGGISFNGRLTLTDSTVADNTAGENYGGRGGGILANGDLIVRNSTITGNTASGYTPYAARGGGIAANSSLDIANSIVAGNVLVGTGAIGDPDISGTITFSNGHNIFGGDVTGSVAGDRENVAPGAVFAALDPDTGGGLLNPNGVVSLLNNVANPALSGADPLAASAAGQLGTSPRPLPIGSLPDIGAIEINQPLSTTASASNDVLTGTSAANTINGLAGSDYLKGLGGNDTLYGGDGGDLLDGGAGNDKLHGDDGIDLVTYTGSTKVVVDLSFTTDTAKRGSETDTLTNVEGAIGSSAADSFKGDQLNNYFQGGHGKDLFTGGGGRDLYDVNAVAESGVGVTKRDVINDFLHLTDDIDLTGIDANTEIAGDQAFRWVGTSALTGAGQVGFFTSGGNTIIRGSNDADAAKEFEIELTGIKTLSIDDFYL